MNKKIEFNNKTELTDEYEDYDPLNDILFSKYMASKGCEKQFLSFINAVFSYHNEETVNDIKIINNKVLYPEIKGQKTCFLDLRSITDGGYKIITELQNQDQYFFENRSVSYICGELYKSGEKGNVENLKNHILINILNFNYCKYNKHNAKFNMLDTTEIKCKYTDLLSIYNLDLVKFRKLKKVDFNNSVDRWAAFFNKKYNRKDFEKVIKMDENIKAAHESAQEFLQDEQTRHEYDLINLIKNQYTSEKDYHAKKYLQIGKKEGKKEGKEEEKLNIAKSLKERGMSIDEIKKVTGLPLNKIKKL